MYNMTMKIKLDSGCFMPERAHTTDAGWDLKTPKRVVLMPHEFTTIDTGVHIQLPPGECAIIIAKSGLLKNYGVLSLGLADEGYTGAIGVTLINLSGSIITFERGDKISQFYITNYYAHDLELVDELEETEMGSDGFGSTGR